MKYKALDLSVKDVDKAQGIVSFYIARFDNEDSDGDIMVKGAGVKSITERGPKGSNRIKHLKNHNTYHTPGKVLELFEDATGIVMVSKLSKTQLGKDTLIEYEEGIITEHSIGFQTIKEEKAENSANFLKEIKIWEGSSLNAWGANYNTPTIGMKTLTPTEQLDKLNERMGKLVKFMKRAEISDDAFSTLEIELMQLKNAYNLLITEKPENDSTFEGKEPGADEGNTLVLSGNTLSEIFKNLN